MFDWTTLLTSSAVSAVITGIIGVLIKGQLDRKLEINKQTFEKEKMAYSANNQRDIETVKSNLNLMQKNLEYFQNMNQVVQSKRIDAIEIVWNEYLKVRKSISPIINLFTILQPTEYLTAINEIDVKDRLNLKSISGFDPLRGLDTVPLLYTLELQRPFLNEILYYKFRSSLIAMLRLKLMYVDMVHKKSVYLWNEDDLFIDHLRIVFSNDIISEGEIPINIDSPLTLLSIIGMMELELNKSIESLISGEVSANLNLERVKKLTQGIQ